MSPWASLKSYNLSKNGYGLWKLTGAATGLGKKKLHWFWLKPGEKWKMWFKSQVKTSPTHKRAIIVYKWLQPFVLVQTSKVLTKNAKENGCKVTTIQIQTWNQVFHAIAYAFQVLPYLALIFSRLSFYGLRFRIQQKMAWKSASKSRTLLLNWMLLCKKCLKKLSLEPDSNQRPKDYCNLPLQSSALPTELSRVT